MTFEPNTHNVLMVPFANDFTLPFFIILDTQLIKTLKSGVHTRICTQLTSDLILGLFFFFFRGGGGISIPILLKTYQGTLLA